MAAVDILVAAKLLHDACLDTECSTCPLSDLCVQPGEFAGYVSGRPHEWDLPRPQTTIESGTSTWIQ